MPVGCSGLPDEGDDDIESTFAGVGRVLSQWETIELELSYLYGHLLNQPDDMDIIRQYGDPITFNGRIDGLCRVAKDYFKQNPHQDTEAEFCDLVSRARGFSARRNDVAHSIVRPIQWITPQGIGDAPLQFCAVPPHYIGKKFDAHDMPAFVYTSVELNALNNALFKEIFEPAQKLKWRL